MSGIGIRLVDAPRSAADDPRARAYIVDYLKPGATIARRVEVINHAATNVRVAVYPAAAAITEDGFVGASGHSQNELSGWASVTPEALELGPEEKALVTVTVEVPKDAVRGEKYGVIWAETTTAPTQPGGVTQVSRVGIRLYLSVGPGGAPPTRFEVVSLAGARDANKLAVVQATVRNTGKRALDLTGSVTLSHGPAELMAGPFPVPGGSTLGIGETAAVLVPLDAQLPDGPWDASITMKSGVTRRTAHAKLTFPSQPGSGPPVPSDSENRWWLIGGGVLAIAGPLIIIGALLLSTRRRRRTAAEFR